MSKGYTNLYNVDPTRQVLRIMVEVDICRDLGLILSSITVAIQTPSTVGYLIPPQISRRYLYTMEGC